MNRRRLTFLTQWFEPEPTTAPVWIAEAMRDEGWDIGVLTGVPNYPDGVVHAGYSPRRRMTEVRRGLRITRTPLYPSHDSSALGRIANYISWALSSAVLGRRVLRGSDAVLVYSSPATAALGALLARVRHSVPFVLLIQDLWPDSIFASGFLNRPLIRRAVEPLVDLFVRWTYRNAFAIAVITPGMRAKLLDRGVPADKVHVVYNWVDETIFVPSEPRGELRTAAGIAPDACVFLYAGNVGAAQALEPLVDAFVGVDRAHLVILGDGIRRPDLMKRAEGVPNVHFLAPAPLARMTALQADADVLVVSLSDDPLFTITMPSKTQASLAAGRPVLAVAAGDVATVVADAEAGVTVPPGDVAAARAAIEHLVSLGPEGRARLGERSRRYYETHMAKSVGARRLSALLEAAADQTQGASL